MRKLTILFIFLIVLLLSSCQSKSTPEDFALSFVEDFYDVKIEPEDFGNMYCNTDLYDSCVNRKSEDVNDNKNSADIKYTFVSVYFDEESSTETEKHYNVCYNVYYGVAIYENCWWISVDTTDDELSVNLWA